MKTAKESIDSSSGLETRIRSFAFWLTLSLLAAVPLAFLPVAHRIFTLPKFAILLAGSCAIAALIGLLRTMPAGIKYFRPLRSKHVFLLCLYLIAITVSTIFGVAPRASLFGSFENQMGLITRLCFLTCFLGLIVGIGESRARLRQTLWVMSLTGLAAALYAFLQFFGRDPFLSPALYTFDSAAGPIVRVIGTIGHADYLGNFLLYTIPLNAALALATRGSARRIALLAMGISISAIVFSGTRGAALGLVAGAIAFSAFEFRPANIRLNRHTVPRAAAVVAIIISFILLIGFNPASRNIAARAITAIKEGSSGAGRTLLWRDSAKMIPAFALTGCGPEGFRKAFPAFRSKELAQLAPGTNNESPHNSYLDAAISYGLPGAIFYIAVIASSLALLIRSRRRAASRATRVISAGLFASLVAVAAHNFFIFDQVSTGLYFFALVALAQVASSVATAENRNAQAALNRDEAEGSATTEAQSPFSFRWTSLAVAVGGLALLSAALWYAIALMKSDVELNQSIQAAGAGDYDGLLSHGERAARGPEMTGAYNFQYARVLAVWADRIQSDLGSDHFTEDEIARVKAARANAIELAIEQTRQSLAHTLTPDSNYSLLAYLALISGNTSDLRAYATEALKWDQYYPTTHWLMAEAYLAEGNREQAQHEAKLALEIKPGLQEARLALMRARGKKDPRQQTVEELLISASEFRQQGMKKKELKNLLLAARKARGPCPDCRRALALAYETRGLYEKAITQWQALIEQSAEPAARHEAQSRIESLKGKASASQ